LTRETPPKLGLIEVKMATVDEEVHGVVDHGQRVREFSYRQQKRFLLFRTFG
jgi:hypothetical protein